MGRKNRNPRSGFNAERLIQPSIGARHALVDSDEFAFFMGGLRYGLDESLPPKVERKGDRIRRRSVFTLYDDTERVGVTVLEKRLAQSHAQRNRIRWSRQDVGRIQGEIKNELDRLELSGRRLEVTFDTVVRLGDKDDKKGRKVALLPEQDTAIAEFFCREHEIAVDGLQGNLKAFQYPYDNEWIPHLTVGRIFKEVPQADLSKAVQTVKNFLPLTVEIEPLTFVAHQEVVARDTSFDIDWEQDDSFGY